MHASVPRFPTTRLKYTSNKWRFRESFTSSNMFWKDLSINHLRPKYYIVPEHILFLRIRNWKFTKNAIDIRYLCLSISSSKHYNVVSRCIQETLVAFSLLLSFLFYRWLLFSPWLFTLFASTFMDCFTPCCGVAHTSEACF